MWLLIDHRLTDTNRYQLTNWHRLVSIDRFSSIAYARQKEKKSRTRPGVRCSPLGWVARPVSRVFFLVFFFARWISVDFRFFEDSGFSLQSSSRPFRTSREDILDYTRRARCFMYVFIKRPVLSSRSLGSTFPAFMSIQDGGTYLNL